MMSGRKANLYLYGRKEPLRVVVIDLVKFGVRVQGFPSFYYWTNIERLEWID